MPTLSSCPKCHRPVHVLKPTAEKKGARSIWLCSNPACDRSKTRGLMCTLHRHDDHEFITVSLYGWGTFLYQYMWKVCFEQGIARQEVELVRATREEWADERRADGFVSEFPCDLDVRRFLHQ